jgi:hypothetical protein
MLTIKDIEIMEKRLEDIRSEKTYKKNIKKDQEKYRKKYKKIRCPYCDSTSKVAVEYWGGIQLRRCKQGHEFSYSYVLQAIKQMALNYKIKI